MCASEMRSTRRLETPVDILHLQELLKRSNLRQFLNKRIELILGTNKIGPVFRVHGSGLIVDIYEATKD